MTPNIEVGGTLVIDSAYFTRVENPDALEAFYSNDFTSRLLNSKLTSQVCSKTYPDLIDEVPDGKFLLGIETETKFSDEDYRISKLETRVRI